MPEHAVQQVWAVSSGSYSDYRVLCVCPSEADAETVASKLRGEKDGWHRDADVEEFVMVTGDVEQTPFLRLSTTLWDDGTESLVNEVVQREWPFGSIYDIAPMTWRWVRAPMHQHRGGRLDVSGTDFDLVRRTYSEKRAQLIAEDAFRMTHEAKGRVAR